MPDEDFLVFSESLREESELGEGFCVRLFRVCVKVCGCGVIVANYKMKRRSGGRTKNVKKDIVRLDNELREEGGWIPWIFLKRRGFLQKSGKRWPWGSGPGLPYSAVSTSAYRSNLKQEARPIRPVNQGARDWKRKKCSRRGREKGDVLARVSISVNLGHVRRRNVPPVKPIPVNLAKPLMAKDVVTSALEVSESLRQIGREEGLKEVLGHAVKVGRVADFAGDDLFVELHWVAVLGEEGWVASLYKMADQKEAKCQSLLKRAREAKRREGMEPHQHLKDQHPQSVPINTLVVPLTLHNLWRQIIRRTAKRPRNVRHILGKPKVGDFDVSVRSEEDVFRLEVAVDDVERMEVVDRKRDFGRVELCDGVGESLANSKRKATVPVNLRRKTKKNERAREREARGLTCDFLKRLNSSPPATKSITM